MANKYFKKTGEDAAKGKAEKLKNSYVDRFKKYGVKSTADKKKEEESDSDED